MSGIPEKRVPCRMVASALVSAGGNSGREVLFSLREKRDCFRVPRHCDSRGHRAGVIPVLDGRCGGRARALLEYLRENWRLPEDWRRWEMPLFLATTTGCIDRLENAVAPEAVGDTGLALLEEAKKLFPVGGGTLTASACASGTRALELAAWSVSSGRSPAAMALGADAVSGFVTAGFGSLGALSAGAARPYALERDGLTLGEAAAGAVLMRDDLADALGLPDLGRVLGWGASCDAAHITAPDGNGVYLEKALRRALQGLGAADLAGIVGHGTGTRYNDAAEIAALRRVFPEDGAPPCFSVKGVTGHTLGATGLVQVLAGLAALDCGEWPGAADVLKEGGLMPEARPFGSGRPVGGRRDFLSLTIGFGGLNDCILIRGGRR